MLDGEINDSTVSNNADLVKLMNTVAQTIYVFTAKFPDRIIYVEPVDERRSFLYHSIFRRHFDVITSVFNLEGMKQSGKWERFQPEKTYLAFRITRKSTA